MAWIFGVVPGGKVTSGFSAFAPKDFSSATVSGYFSGISALNSFGKRPSA